MKNKPLSGLPFEWMIGLRYTLSRRKGRSDGFVSFISAMSMASIALGVMALIIVLSVMNGFQKEVRDKMLSVLSHAEVLSIGAPIPDWQKTAAELKKQQPEIIGAAPFLRGQGLLTSGTNVRGVQLNGIDPETESQVSDVAKNMKIGRLSDLKPGEFKIILGTDLARMLGVIPGEKVNVMVPQGQFTPAGTMPRMRQFTVAGVFNSGHYEFDSAMSFINLTDAEKLMRTQTPGGIRLKLSNMQDAPRVAAELNNQMPPGLFGNRLVSSESDLVCGRSSRKTHDGHHFVPDRFSRRVWSSLFISDDRQLQTQRHRNPSNPRRNARFDHAHLYGSGRLHRNRRRADRCRRGASHCLQCGLHRRRDRTAVRRSVPAQRNLLYLGNAE